MTVSALVARIRGALLDAFAGPVTVVGEVSNFKRHSSGHLYFSLKDEAATIDAVMFRTAASAVRFELADGLEVVAEGRVDVYEKQGRLQLYVDRLTPKGTGALELAFRQLKERLEREGLFDPAHKKPLVRFPRAIGVVTSPTGAAIRDISRTLRRRWPAARVYLVGVRVQGDQAAGEIAEAVGLLDAASGRFQIDTIIVARGGGSLEDLWAFNTEQVARAIFAAGTPVISGVGHEVDFTIADFVADVRAATPTAAAELAVPDGAELGRRVTVLARRLARRVRENVQVARAALRAVQRSVVFRDPAARVRSARQHLDELASRMQMALARHRRAGERRLARAEAALAAQHPRRLVERAGGRLDALAHRLAWALG
ncbi:MAG: exodeoxyribonuclease VII large subunit, partial [Planctomycetales bacterium 4484_123]